MSSVVPKNIRPKGKIPVKFSDLDRNVQFVSKIVKVAIGNCFIGGSHVNGFPALDSDIDIYLNELATQEQKEKVNTLSEIFNVKIDLGVKGSRKTFEI